MKTIAIVGLIYLSCIFVTACAAQLQLIVGAAQVPAFMNLVIAPLFAVPMVIASGLIPAAVLRSHHVHNRIIYLANAIVSAIIAAYAFIFNFGVADNLGAILLHVPRKDAANGWIYEPPPFTATLTNIFRSIPIVWHEWQSFVAVVLFALFVGAICTLFMSRSVSA